MRLAFFGDVVGRSGRRAIKTYVPDLRAQLGLDAVIVNGENTAGGFGINEKTACELYDAGADVITLGNHSFDNVGALTYIEREPRLLRPVNYPPGTVPGKGAGLFEVGGYRLLVINVLGSVFMDALDDPFVAVEKELHACPLGDMADAVLVDIHAEATSEKQAMGHFCDGRASLVAGTHQHVPTADTRILAGGTAFQTDVGMCGDYSGVIGMDKEEPLRRFTTRLRGGRFTPGSGEPALCGIFIETNPQTGLAMRAGRICLGGGLVETVPHVSA